MNETDVEGAIGRVGDWAIYTQVLAAFPADESMTELEEALDNSDWDGAFTAAHALKGLASNIGFVPLSHSIGELVILIRSGRINEVHDAFLVTKGYYDDIVAVINNHLKVSI